MGYKNGFNMDVIYLDFAKAFDKVKISTLLDRMHKAHRATLNNNPNPIKNNGKPFDLRPNNSQNTAR